jgi:hypothetical protein
MRARHVLYNALCCPNFQMFIPLILIAGAAPLLNMSNYLLDSHVNLKGEKGASRYGAMTVASDSSLSNLFYNVFVNGSSVHGAGIYVNLMHTAFLRVLTDSSTAKIKIRNAPLPRCVNGNILSSVFECVSRRTYKQDQQSANIDAFTASLFLMIAFCFIPASYAIFVVKEVVLLLSVLHPPSTILFEYREKSKQSTSKLSAACQFMRTGSPPSFLIHSRTLFPLRS